MIEASHWLPYTEWQLLLRKHPSGNGQQRVDTNVFEARHPDLNARLLLWKEKLDRQTRDPWCRPKLPLLKNARAHHNSPRWRTVSTHLNTIYNKNLSTNIRSGWYSKGGYWLIILVFIDSLSTALVMQLGRQGDLWTVCWKDVEDTGCGLF
jgi:hypothetical protein